MTHADYWVGVWMIMCVVMLAPHIKENSSAIKFSSACVAVSVITILIKAFS